MAEQRLPRFAIESRIGRITLDDPATYNSLSPAAFLRLGEIFAEVRARANRDLDALVLTGSGKAFCAGADLGSLARLGGETGTASGSQILEWMKAHGAPVMKAWQDPAVPMVSAVNGVTVGIGVSLALSADIAIAGRSASFKLPFLPGLGLMPDGGLTWLLPRRIGFARTQALTLLGDKLDAQQAADWGLIWRCVDDAALEGEAMAVAQRLSRLPVYAAREMRAAQARALDHDLASQCDYELERDTRLLEGPEFEEGLRAFLEKREPRFRPS